jgi:hypothetical protein
MKKLCFLTSLFVCLNQPVLSHANTETHNWCGIYFEKAEQAFIRIPMADLHKGSSFCTTESYAERVGIAGSVNIALDFRANRSNLGNWRKFDNHVLEISGKLKNGTITRTRLIRDAGM